MARRRRDPRVPTAFRPIPIYLDRGPVTLTIGCPTCGQDIPATLEPEALLRQLDEAGRITLERACLRCELIFTVFLEGART